MCYVSKDLHECLASQTGFLDSQPLREADEDLASEVSLNNSNMTEEEREEILQELTKVRTDTFMQITKPS